MILYTECIYLINNSFLIFVEPGENDIRDWFGSVGKLSENQEQAFLPGCLHHAPVCKRGTSKSTFLRNSPASRNILLADWMAASNKRDIWRHLSFFIVPGCGSHLGRSPLHRNVNDPGLENSSLVQVVIFIPWNYNPSILPHSPSSTIPLLIKGFVSYV